MWPVPGAYGKLIGVGILAALLVGAYFVGSNLLDGYVDARLNEQAAEVSVESKKLEEERVRDQTAQSLREVQVILSKIEDTRAETEELNEKLKLDWENKLKTDPLEWITNTNDDALDQLRRGQEVLRNLRITTVNM